MSLLAFTKVERFLRELRDEGTLQNENSTPMRAMRGGRMALIAPYVELDT